MHKRFVSQLDAAGTLALKADSSPGLTEPDRRMNQVGPCRVFAVKQPIAASYSCVYCSLLFLYALSWQRQDDFGFGQWGMADRASVKAAKPGIGGKPASRPTASLSLGKYPSSKSDARPYCQPHSLVSVFRYTNDPKGAHEFIAPVTPIRRSHFEVAGVGLRERDTL